MRYIILLCLTLIIACSPKEHHNEEKNATKPNEKQNFTIGKVVKIDSKILNESRTLNIYLPQGYEQDSIKDYPVIYLLDGSADEDFIHIAGIVQFGNFPWVNMLPRSIVVGIGNVDRKRDFTYPTTIEKDKKDFPTTGGSAKFIEFIETELQPYIQEKYSKNDTTTMIGQSLGGLLATEILFKKPQLFLNYVIISPSLWWDNQSLLSIDPKTLSPDFQQQKSIYIAVGKEGKIMETDAKALAELVQNAKNDKLTTYFKYFGAQDHANIMHVAVYDAFEVLF